MRVFYILLVALAMACGKSPPVSGGDGGSDSGNDGGTTDGGVSDAESTSPGIISVGPRLTTGTSVVIEDEGFEAEPNSCSTTTCVLGGIRP